MKIVIIEDEQPAAQKLVQLLKRAAPGAEVLAVLESVEESVNWLATHPAPDLIFVDIQLDDGISFEIFETLKIEAPVIFTTAFDQYAIRAFKVNSVDYLLKPIDGEALKKALQKFDRLHARPASWETRLEKIMEQIPAGYKSRFLIKIGAKYQPVPAEKVCCFFVEERNTFLRTVEGKTYDLDYSLDQVQHLTDPGKFFRINRNFLVNINCIEEIFSYSTSRLKLKLLNFANDDIIVSRDKVPEFKRWMDR